MSPQAVEATEERDRALEGVRGILDRASLGELKALHRVLPGIALMLESVPTEEEIERFLLGELAGSSVVAVRHLFARSALADVTPRRVQEAIDRLSLAGEIVWSPDDGTIRRPR